MNSVKRKLNNLEKNNLLQQMVKGSTVLDMYNIPDAEYQVFMQAKKIATGVKLEELTPEQEQVLLAASSRMGDRIFDLFIMWVESNVCVRCGMATAQFKKRLIWFLQELKAESAMWIKADEIEEEHKGDSDEVDYVDKFFETQPEFFTSESWYKLENEIMQDYMKHLKSTPEGKKWLKKNTS